MIRARNIKIATLLLLAAIATTTKAQDARFTQTFYSNPLKLNPAIMGMNPDLKAMLNYRTQWVGVGKGYTSASFTCLYPLFMGGGKEKLEIGLNVMNDKEGAFSALDAALAIGYNLKLSNSGYLSFSLQGGYVQKSLDVDNLTFDDQYVLGSYSSSNPSSQMIASESTNFMDLGFGMMWYYSPDDEDAKLNAYTGVSGYHMNEPDETLLNSDGTLPRRFALQAGVKIRGENKIDFTPNVVTNWQKGSQEFAGGLIMDYRISDAGKMMLGVWYRTKDAYPIMIGFEHRYFMLNYSYDVTSSALSNAISGLTTHEITLAFRMNMAEKKNVTMAPSMY